MNRSVPESLLICILVLCLALTPVGVRGETEDSGKAQKLIEAPGAVLMEKETGTVIYSRDPDTRRSPASITKIMTLILIFDAIREGTLHLEDSITTSAYARSMGGSQVFLEEGEKQTAETMIKCIVIASGNDASVAMAEHVAGTEQAFVEKMNQKAQELGLVNTHFVNCTGFDEEEHYTCAQDVATMARELMTKHGEEITKYSTIWMDSLRNGETELVNTNRLVRFYDGTTGLKTGTTDAAGHCLCATATRNGMSLISVIMGCQSSDARFEESKQLLDYGFSSFMIYEGELTEGALDPIKVVRGEKTEVVPQAQTMPKAVIRKEEAEQMEVSVERPEQVEAPLEQGQQIGSVVLLKNGQEVSREPLTATEAIGELTFGKSLRLLCRSLVTMQ